MQEQTARQQGRARARQARVKVREEQVQRERRLARLGERVAVAERDAVVADCEQRTGRALRSMVKDEGLSTREALAWCGVELTAREVHRLIREADAGVESSQGGNGKAHPAPLPCVSGAPAPGRG
jgi:hypothetical protein